MKSPFGKRLFRLFLLFALVPAIILALVGYYLASREGLGTLKSNPRRVASLADYHNKYLYTKIESDITRWEQSRGPDIGSLDFLISSRDTTSTIVGATAEPSREAVSLLIQSATSKPRGFVQLDTVFYQYSASDNTAGGITVGGLVHGQAYVNLTEYIQSDLSAVSSQRVLTANYVVFLAILFLVLAAFTALVAYYFSAKMSNNLASPLTSLSKASSRIADGDFDQRVEVTGFGEIKILIESFNRMAQQLRVTTSRLTQAERVAAWRNVARRFAHELKNPLQPIMVSIYRLENTLKDSDQYESIRQPLEAASEELRHLTELADRFSQLAKLPEPKIDSVNLNEFLQSIADLYVDRLSRYDFVLEIPTDVIVARIDETYFREAIHNLLQNAIDASSEGGKISLALRKETSAAIIEIQDRGRGMSEETMSSARMPYFTTKSDGSGIGLAVVDKVVSEIDGSMFIDSVLGEGTTITISVPVRAVHE